jgi:hypothetical protein
MGRKMAICPRDNDFGGHVNFTSVFVGSSSLVAPPYRGEEV